MSRPNCITPIPKGIQIALLILILLALLANFSEPVFCEPSKGIPLPAPIPASLPLEITGLSTQKIELLKNGEALIRQLDTASKLSLAPFSAEASAILKEIAQLNPNYLVEVIALVPYTPGAKQIERLAITLSDIQGYIGIPYYSVREKKTYDLFDKVNILLRKTIPGGELIEAEQHMKPFEDYKASYEYRYLPGQSWTVLGTELTFAAVFIAVSLKLPSIWSFLSVTVLYLCYLFSNRTHARTVWRRLLQR